MSKKEHNLMLLVLGMLTFAVLLLSVGFFAVSVTRASECNWKSNNDPFTEYPNDEHCDGNGEIVYQCNTVYLTASVSGEFALVERTDTDNIETVYNLSAGATVQLSPASGTLWVEAYYQQDMIGLVDIVEQEECTQGNVVYPPDDRVNWQGGDHYAVAYIEEYVLSVYGVSTGEGVLVLQLDLSTLQEYTDVELPYQVTCSTDSSVCGYLLDTGELQLNIVDLEGKLFEVIVYTVGEDNV